MVCLNAFLSNNEIKLAQQQVWVQVWVQVLDLMSQAQ
jgi:hypothetical protein